MHENDGAPAAARQHVISRLVNGIPVHPLQYAMTYTVHRLRDALASYRHCNEGTSGPRPRGLHRRGKRRTFSPMLLDILASRRRRYYSRREQLGRVAWSAAQVVFRLSPRPAYRFRAAMLRVFGATIAEGVQIHASARIELPWNLEVGRNAAIGESARVYNLGKITIGEAATISQGAHLCAGTHDYTHPEMPLLRTPLKVDSQAWVCADSFVGPGVTIGEGAVLGARGVAIKSIEEWTIATGNPARPIRKRQIRAP